METSPLTLKRAIVGSLLGTAIGDAIGLPGEGLSRRRMRALFGDVPEGYRFLFGRGMVSDDTEQTLLVAAALTVSIGDTERFERELARGLRRWICLLPAGVGWATLRACLRLLIGIPPARSGVRSAGNGPAMRSALLGVVRGNDIVALRSLVQHNTRLTHTDPRAEYGAMAVALAASRFAWGRTEPTIVLTAIDKALPCDADANTLRELLGRIQESWIAGESTATFAAERLGLPERVTGYVYHTVPVALHAALSHPNDFRAAILSAIACGGDTDTIAAIVGGIVGAHVGAEGIPERWRTDLAEWPCTITQMERIATRLAAAIATRKPQTPLTAPWLALLLRNGLFLVVTLYHGLRRLLPPY